mmetsp:Transcript_19066/g.27424  ORF Transcript_19066/g.27424 Transcript_19066/m.27424 type:complete len:161 (-) Transcript_19066:1415-1897(-)
MKKFYYPHRWGGIPLEGIPYAGKELWVVKQHNQEHFGNNDGTSAGVTTSKNEQQDHQQHVSLANPTSVLAPPLGATYSASLGWRPRPFHDRPALQEYGLACPLQINVDFATTEPLICSMALYMLPVVNDNANDNLDEDDGPSSIVDNSQNNVWRITSNIP